MHAPTSLPADVHIATPTDDRVLQNLLQNGYKSDLEQKRTGGFLRISLVRASGPHTGSILPGPERCGVSRLTPTCASIREDCPTQDPLVCYPATDRPASKKVS